MFASTWDREYGHRGLLQNAQRRRAHEQPVSARDAVRAQDDEVGSAAGAALRDLVGGVADRYV